MNKCEKKYRNYILEYKEKIDSGEEKSNKWIKKLYEKILEGLEEGLFFLDLKKAHKAITFIENFCHHNKTRRDLIKLKLWQKALITLIFGIVDDKSLRVWREVFIVIGRKNGKTILAAAIIAYMAFIEDEYGAEIYCLAPKLDQAEIIYNDFWQIVQSEPELKELSRKRKSDIYIACFNTSVKKIAFNAKKSDGYNPQMVTNDEVASWRGDPGLKQYEVMKSGLGARSQPLILSISTAGYENDGIYDELMNRSTAWLKGSSKEKRLLPILYIIDDPEKWNDIEELKKANPNMGVSVSESFFRDEIDIAEGSVSKKTEFLVKYCNIKQNSSQAWLDGIVVQKTAVDMQLDDFKNCYGVGGVDLSQTTDLTAASVVIEKNGVLYAFAKFFIPARKLETSKDGVPYDIFVKKGIVQISGENYVDYKDVLKFFIELHQKYKIYIL